MFRGVDEHIALPLRAREPGTKMGRRNGDNALRRQQHRKIPQRRFQVSNMFQYLAHENDIEASGMLLDEIVSKHSAERFEPIHPLVYLAAYLGRFNGRYLETVLQRGAREEPVSRAYIEEPWSATQLPAIAGDSFRVNGGIGKRNLISLSFFIAAGFVGDIHSNCMRGSGTGVVSLQI